MIITIIMSKELNERYILNPDTNRYVLKSGTTGKHILGINKKIKIPKKIVPHLPKPIIPKNCILILDRLGCWQIFHLSYFISSIHRIKNELLIIQSDKESVIHRIHTTILIGTLILIKKNKPIIIEYTSVHWRNLVDNLASLDVATQSIKWYPMIVRILTGTGKESKPYWYQSYTDLSQKLWLPTLVESEDVYLECESLYENTNSWFTIKKTEPIIKDSSILTSIECQSMILDSVDIKKESTCSIQRTRKVRIYPNKSIIKQFKTWIAGTICIYNKIVYFQEHCSKEDKNMSEDKLKRKFVYESIVTRKDVSELNKDRKGSYKLKGIILDKQSNPDIIEWTKKLPKVVREGAAEDYCIGRNAAFTNVNLGNIARFKMKYRNYKNDPAFHISNRVQSISNGKYIKLFPRILKKVNITNPHILVNKGDRSFVEQYIGKKPKQQCKIKYEYGHWYLVIPYMSDVQPISIERGACAIDPGVRTPLTLYDAERFISFHYKKEIYTKLIKKLHILQSLRDKKYITSHSYKKARFRIRRRWTNLVNDMHYKCASYLVSKYSVIGIPSFETSKMVTGSLYKKTKLELLDWCHFKFKTRLLSKARQLSYVLHPDESYTTQSCTNCGTLNYVGGAKIYDCKKCHHKIGRDEGSSRSIYMCMMLGRLV